MLRRWQIRDNGRSGLARCGRIGRAVLESVAEDLWIADGEPVRFFGIPYPTRMAVVRLPAGELWVWSPIELRLELALAVERLGPVRHLVTPNKLHHLFLSQWQARWPDARLYSPPGLRRRRTDLRFDGDLGDVPDPAWKDAIDPLVVRGSFFMSEVWFLHRPSRSLIVGDLVQRFEPASLRPWQAWVMRLDGMVGPSGSTPREWRATFWNRASARACVRRALGWGPERLVIAHGAWAPERGEEVLRSCLRWLHP